MTLLRTFVLRGESDARQLHDFLKSNWRALANDAKPLAVTVSEHKKKRNGQQNRLYWSLLNQIAEQVWIGGRRFSSEAWHEMAARKFIGFEELPDGSLKAISTTTLSVGEFAEYVTKVQSYAASELGIEFYF